MLICDRCATKLNSETHFDLTVGPGYDPPDDHIVPVLQVDLCDGCAKVVIGWVLEWLRTPVVEAGSVVYGES